MPSEKQLAGNQRRILRTMRTRLLVMAAQWEDVDPFNLSQLTDLADKAEQVAVEMVAEPADG